MRGRLRGPARIDRRLRLGPALVAAGLLALAPAGPAAAEEVTLQVLGVNGFTPPENRTAQRQAAVSEALRAAVYQVVAESLPALDAEAAGDVARSRFGRDFRDFVTRFRVVDDQGVQPKRLSTNRSATHEYVVRVEASVDALQVRERLEAAGLLSPGDGALRPVRLTLEELPSYAALESVRQALVDRLQAESVTPVEFTAGRAVLAVRTRTDARRLLERLSALDLGPWRVEPRAVGSDAAVAAVRPR